MNTDDSILLRRWVSERDADAFVQVAMRHAKMVYGVALRILGNSHDAEEVAQDCFEVLASTTKPPKDNLSGWLYQVAANQAKNRVRSEQRRQEREEKYWTELLPTIPPMPDVSWDDVYRSVDEVILELPESYREPLVAHFFGQETHQQIAQRLGIPRRTVTNHIQQGIESIRQALKKRGIPVTVAAIGTWFEAQATAVSPLPAALAAKIARIGLAGVGEEIVVTNSNVSLLGKLSGTKWLGSGIAAALLVGGVFFLGSRPPQSPEPAPVSAAPVTSEREKAPATSPVIAPPKVAVTPAAISKAEDPLASLWGWWSVEIKLVNEPITQTGNYLVEIHQEDSQIVISDSTDSLILSGPIHGFQLQMRGTLSVAFVGGRIILSGTYAPNADSFSLRGSFCEEFSSNDKTPKPIVSVFTRMKGAAAAREQRKTELKAIYSALDEYKTDSSGRYPERLEEVMPFFKGNIALLTSSPGREIIYRPEGLTKPKVLFSDDMLQWDSEVQYADQIIAVEARLAKSGVYQYLFHPALVSIKYANPIQRIAVDSFGNIREEVYDTQFSAEEAEKRCDSCQTNLVHSGLTVFADQHHGYLPGGWAMHGPTQGNPLCLPRRLSCPCRPIGDNSYELLFPAVCIDSFCLELCEKVMGENVDVAKAQSMVPMVVERSIHTIKGKQGRNVLFFDNHVEFVPLADLPQKVDRFVQANK